VDQQWLGQMQGDVVNLRTDEANHGRIAAGHRRRSRVLAALSIALCGMALLVGSALTGATSAGAIGTITVEQTALPYQGGCNALGRLQWTYSYESTDAAFKLVVRNPTTLCDPVAATAVIYQMPADGSRWPQTLAASQTFSIGGASITTITFSKDCTPVQFDVVTGATPPVISPVGPFHGPLLFPLDTNTTRQYNGCTTTTTSTSTSTSTTSSTTSSTTTTSEPSVAGITTLPSESTTSTTPQAATVESATTAQDPASLAFTGSPSGQLAALGAAMLLGGLGLLAWTRRGRSVA
jgi:hypothetical protein